MPRVHRQLDEWVEIANPQRWITGAGTGGWTTTGTYTWTVTTTANTAMYYDYNGWRIMGANVEQQVHREPARTPEQLEQRRRQLEEWEAGREAREARDRERRAEMQRQQQEHAERRRVANARAQELLLEILDDAQQATYRENGYIEVIGSAGNRYRIRTEGAISGNVDLMHGPEGDMRVAAYCAHGPGLMPSNDHYIQQLLALETDEAAFRRVANHYSTYADVPREPSQAEAALARRMADAVRERRQADALIARRHQAAGENDRNAPPPPGEGDDGAAVLAVLGDEVVVQAGELYRRGALARAP